MSSLRSVFAGIYHSNGWGGRESLSGKGSDIENTERLIPQLNKLLRDLNVETMLDVPCGDFNWMQLADLTGIIYTGADVVPELIEDNRKKFGDENRVFIPLDLTCSLVPEVDLIWCRDCLVHLPFDAAKKALFNMQDSGSKYLAMTTFPLHHENYNIAPGRWYPINVQDDPFNWPEPDYWLVEQCRQDYPLYVDKAMGVWKLG